VTQMQTDGMCGFEFFQACCFGIESDDGVQNSKREGIREHVLYGFGRSVGGSSVGGNGRKKRGMPGHGGKRETHNAHRRGERERRWRGSLLGSFLPRNSSFTQKLRPTHPEKTSQTPKTPN
jgi:hypothetical protein